MGFMSAICFSWSWILRNVDFGEKLLWFVRCVWWKDNWGMGACRGIFLHAHPRCSVPVYQLHVRPFFHSFTPTCSAICFKCKLTSISSFVHEHSGMQNLLLAAKMYTAKYLHISQTFRPSLVPTVRPLTHGSQPILSSYRMRQCRTWGG